MTALNTLPCDTGMGKIEICQASTNGMTGKLFQFSVNGGNGLGGYLNGHFTPPGAYVAQACAQWTVRAGRGSTLIPEGDNQIAKLAPAHRVVVTGGKVGNYALYDSPAWDFAQNGRGLTRAVFVEWIHPRWTVRGGSAQVATTAGGPELSWDLLNNRGDLLEADQRRPGAPLRQNLDQAFRRQPSQRLGDRKARYSEPMAHEALVDELARSEVELDDCRSQDLLDPARRVAPRAALELRQKGICFGFVDYPRHSSMLV